MATRRHTSAVVRTATLLFLVVAGAGCSGLEYHDIYMAGIGGAVVGAIIGHQSDECAAGAAIGAAVFATGELLDQIDDASERQMEEAAEEVARGTDVLSVGFAGPALRPSADSPSLVP